MSGEGLARFFSLTSPFLDERERRLLAASMVEVLGRGGQARVAEATGMSRNTLMDGTKDLAEGPVAGDRVRRPGGQALNARSTWTPSFWLCWTRWSIRRAGAIRCPRCVGHSSLPGSWPAS